MLLLRKRIRGFFALQAIGLLAALAVSLVRSFRAENGIAPLFHLEWQTTYLGFSLVFAKAWWTTRKPSSSRSLWAVAASCISLGGGLYFCCSGHSRTAAICRGLVMIILGIAGLVIFSQGGAPAKPDGESLTQAA